MCAIRVELIVSSAFGINPFTVLPDSSNSTFSQPFEEKCISDVVRIGSIII